MNLIRWNNNNDLLDMFDKFFYDDHSHMYRNRKYCGPATNVIENNDAFELDLAVPGMDKNDFRLSLENNLLTISSEKKEEHNEEKTNYTRKEFSYGSFSRSFTLPKSVDPEKIKAVYKEGILGITLPKKEESKVVMNKEIKIS